MNSANRLHCKFLCVLISITGIVARESTLADAVQPANGKLEVNSFWGGEPLGTLELLCIRSFLHHDVCYNLYVYDEPANVPSGVELRDARPILPADRQFVYPTGTFNGGSLAAFSNLFRYTLLESRGGCWVDTDVCCLEPFGAGEFYVREQTQNEDFLVATCVFSAPRHSPVLSYCRDVAAHKDI